MQNNLINKKQKNFLEKDAENDFILVKHDIQQFVNNISIDDLYNEIFSHKEIMDKLSIRTLLYIYEKILDSVYNNISNIELWHLELLLNIYKKNEREIKIFCYNILQKLKFNNTVEIQNLLILNKIYVGEYLVPNYFTCEQLNILKLDEEKKLFFNNKNSIEILETYDDLIIYNLFLSKEFLINLSIESLIYIIKRIVKSVYNNEKFLFSEYLEILLKKYNSSESIEKNQLIKNIFELNFGFNEQIITLFIKNYCYSEKYFSNILFKDNFRKIVFLNCKINFNENNIDDFTNMIDFFLIIMKKYNLTYNLLNIKKFKSFLKIFTKNNYIYLTTKYGIETSCVTRNLGFYFFNQKWYKTCY